MIRVVVLDRHVEAARAVGYWAVVHRSTPESIAEVEAVIEAASEAERSPR